MKTVLQSEPAECGLACLAAISNFHGKKISLRDLRGNFSLSMKGARLSSLIGIADRLGFQSRAIRIDISDLDKVKVPCVLHWNMNHFVVLEKTTKGGAVIHDPAIGMRRVDAATLSQSFTGVVLELSPTAEFQKAAESPRVSIIQLTGSIRGLASAAASVVTLSLALQLFILLAPFYLQWVVDQAILSADQDLLTVLGIGFIIALLAQVIIGWVRGWAVIHLSAMLGMQWHNNVFAHLMRLRLGFFERRHLGDITSRMGSIDAIQRTLSTSFVEALIDGLTAIVTLTLMMIYSWKLALITLAAVLCYAVTRTIAYRALRSRTERQLIAGAKQQTHLLESLRGMQSLKIAGREPVRRSAYANLLNDKVNETIWIERAGQWYASINSLTFGIERIVVIWVGATLALDGLFTVGMLVAYLAYKDQFSTRTAALIDKWIEFRMLRLHGERLGDIVLTPPDNDLSISSEDHVGQRLRIEVENVSFKYSEGDDWVLRNCNFSVDPGESIAIIGPSGSGKTTLLKLMLGVLDVTEGSIRVGGQDMAKKGARSVRMRFGAVMQDDQLFAGSISDNISFFDSDPNHERVIEVAKLAAIHDEIMAMPMQYQSLIGDMGSSLSGGQKQRVILARALYAEPSVLFLDEATSHLDVQKESEVNLAIKQLNITKIIVAHRPETIRSADRVIAISGGAALEVGKS